MEVSAGITSSASLYITGYVTPEHGSRLAKINVAASDFLIKNTAAGEGNGAKCATGISCL